MFGRQTLEKMISKPESYRDPFHNYLYVRHLSNLSDKIDNMYTSFKGFQLVGIWQEKFEIIVITDIKQEIVIIQLVVLQRFPYYRQIGITPTR